MYKILWPTKDATIYERFSDKNTGVDQILELYSVKIGQSITEDNQWESNYNSRILLHFDVSSLNSKINGSEFTAFLSLKSVHSVELPINYTIYAYPISGSWDNGTGYYNNNPSITNGVSWKFKSSKLVNNQWNTSSYTVNSTGSWATVNGGGNWYYNISASQEFNYELPNIRMNITPIVKSWISGSIPNNGVILKYSDESEQDLNIYGNIQFFSKDTHTIYIPKLEVYWNDRVMTGTGSFSEVSSDNCILYISNLKESYSANEQALIRLSAHNKYVTQTYATSSNYLNKKRLPIHSYYMIQDVVTDEIIIPYDVIGTIVNCDALGNYIIVDFGSLLPERYYKIVLRLEYDDGNIIMYIDDNYIFRLTRH